MEKIKEFLQSHFWFDLFSVVAVGLLIASFIVPPTGVIDPSVLAATGILFAFAALYIVMIAVDKGVPASISHNNTTVTVNRDSEQI